MTPLHWAAVKGNRVAIRHLIEAGADLDAKEESGKTPRDMAEELKGPAPFQKALEEAGYMSSGLKRIPRLSPVSLACLRSPKLMPWQKNTKRVIFVLPTVVLGIIFKTLDLAPWYVGWPLALAEFWAMQIVSILQIPDTVSSVDVVQAVVNGLLGHEPPEGGVSASPHFAAIITASIFWVFYTFATRLITRQPYV